MSELNFQIEGMHCGACVNRVTKALNAVPGAQVEEVRVGAARIRTDDQAPADQYLAAIKKAGFDAHLVQ
jgi:copper chaperone